MSTLDELDNVFVHVLFLQPVGKQTSCGCRPPGSCCASTGATRAVMI